MGKVKVLFVGCVSSPDVASVVLEKMAKVASKGLEIAFGSCLDGDALMKLKMGPLPIPLYLQDTNETIASTRADKIDVDEESKSPCYQLATNLFVLRDQEGLQQELAPGMWRLPVGERNHLVVASVSPQFRESSEFFERITKHVSYTGCDILVSTEWPQGIETLLSTPQPENLLSYDVTSLALQVRSHYHVSLSAISSFVQSPPFRHTAAVTSTVAPRHTGRFIALGPAGGSTKWMHAVGMVPIHQESNTVASEIGAAAPCPYLNLVGDMPKSAAGLSEETARKLIAEDRGMGRKRGHSNDDTAADPENRSLFVYGLHLDVTRRLQDSDDALLQALKGSTRVRRSGGAAFAFVDFANHRDASACIGEQTILGVKLTFRWARMDRRPPAKRQRLREEDTKDSSTVYFKVSGSKNGESIHSSHVGESLRTMLEETLEKALGEGIKASEEPALQVKLRLPETESSFGFFDFASHAAASMALATLTGSTDGGRVEHITPEDTGKDSTIADSTIYLHWARPLQEHTEDSNIVKSSGFQFERRHFPADSRSDCWFCLASPDCEKHLIVGVYDLCYTAMPKGPVHPGHVLLVPVHHSSEGVLFDKDVCNEMDRTKLNLRQHADRSFDSDLFIFERAIETKGGYHAHIQCIPLRKNLGDHLEHTMREQSTRLGLECFQVTSNEMLHEKLQEYRQYFYAEIPTLESSFKRFLVLPNERARVPLQFGRELVASVLKQPVLAHWKSCVTDIAKETELASSFQTSFQAFLEEQDKKSLDSTK